MVVKPHKHTTSPVKGTPIMFNEIKEGIWSVGNDILFANKAAVYQFASATGVAADVDSTEYPARGVLTDGILNLSSSGSIRLAVDQLLEGSLAKNNQVCTKLTYTSVCGRRKTH